MSDEIEKGMNAIDKMFSYQETTRPIRFFYKLPLHIRASIVRENSDALAGIESNIFRVFMQDICYENYVEIRDNADSNTFFTFVEKFFEVQPILVREIESRNLYEQYPEYLI